jgi:hypothetical protein
LLYHHPDSFETLQEPLWTGARLLSPLTLGTEDNPKDVQSRVGSGQAQDRSAAADLYVVRMGAE